MLRKELGCIATARFSNEEGWLGFYFDLKGQHWGVMDRRVVTNIAHSANCKWSQEEREKELAGMSMWVNDLMSSAKVYSLDRLVGKPVEVVFEGNKLVSWRILEEVLL